MCCKGKEIPYKDYTPQDQLGLRQSYNYQMQQGLRTGATPYGNQNPFMAQMNPLQAMAMQAMFQQGGGQGQIQLPGYASYGQVFGQPAPQGALQPGMGMQGMAGGQFANMRPPMGQMGQGGPMQQGQGGTGGQVPFWLMMPGGGMQGGMPGSGPARQ